MAYQEKNGDAPIPAPAMDYIVAVLKRMRFGEVTLVAQDGKLVQIEHTNTATSYGELTKQIGGSEITRRGFLGTSFYINFMF